MSNEPYKFIAICSDSTGRPCAWGSAPTREKARAEAERQLELWKAKKDPAELFPPFTCKVRTP